MPVPNPAPFASQILTRLQPIWQRRRKRARAGRGISELPCRVERLERRSLLSALGIGPMGLSRLEEPLSAVVEPLARAVEQPAASADSLHRPAIDIPTRGHLANDTGPSDARIGIVSATPVGSESTPAFLAERHDSSAVAVNSAWQFTPAWIVTINLHGNGRAVRSLAIVMAMRISDYDGGLVTRAVAASVPFRSVTPHGSAAAVADAMTSPRIDRDSIVEPRPVNSDGMTPQGGVHAKASIDQPSRTDSRSEVVPHRTGIAQESGAPRSAPANSTSDFSTTVLTIDATAPASQSAQFGTSQPGAVLAVGSRTDQRFSQLAGLMDSSQMAGRVVATTAMAPLTFSGREAELLVWHSGVLSVDRAATDSPVKTILTDSLTAEDGPPPAVLATDAETQQVWSAEPAPAPTADAGLLPLAPDAAGWPGWLSDPRLWLASAVTVLSSLTFWRRRGRRRLEA